MTPSHLIRPYRGTPAEDRVARRRRALLDAALQVFDTEGWSGVSARRVCERAGLTRRYFYESFDDVDALLAELFEEVTGEVRAAVRAAVTGGDAPPTAKAHQAISRGLDVLTAAPVKGRFIAGAQSAGGAVAAHRARAIDDLASIVETGFTARQGDSTRVGARRARAAAIGAVGAALQIVDSWLSGEVDLTRDEAAAWSAAAALGVITAVSPGSLQA
ncbi:TetR/AcrR family transcriptional regulator [Streptomyces cacaoi]|uniref:TetR/AcrR family transcriptional regulator n=1 Tax=Streptomyces cacaoi TaxID=1898 RepID=UPI0037499454